MYVGGVPSLSRVESLERRVRHKEELRGRILDAARKLFAEHGFDAVTMRQIAGAIGYTATTLYSYFPDKMSLLLDLCHGDFATLRQQVGEVQSIADPVDRLDALGRAYARFMIDHPHHARLMFMTPLPAKSALACVESGRGDPTSDTYALVVTMVQAVDAAGRLRPEFRSHHLAAQLFWAGVHGVVALHLDKGHDAWVPWTPIEDRVEGMIRALREGITRPAPAVS